MKGAPSADKINTARLRCAALFEKPGIRMRNGPRSPEEISSVEETSVRVTDADEIRELAGRAGKNFRHGGVADTQGLSNGRRRIAAPYRLMVDRGKANLKKTGN